MRITRRFVTLLLAFALPLSGALASDHGGGEAGASTPMVFTVNLGTERYLQVGLLTEAATPEAAQLFAARKPRFLHRVILLLGEQLPESLMTLQGKLKLQESILDIANEVIDERPKTGIREVLFSNFIIQ